MRRHLYRKKRKSSTAILLLILVFLLLCAVTGGVAAYLSASSEPVSNQFDVQSHPNLTVNSDNSITVSGTPYAVYIRAAVVVNWKTGSGSIVADMPVQGTDYNQTIGSGWEKKGDFYYYNSPILGAQQSTTTSPVVTVTPITSSDDRTLSVTVVAQAIQAVGEMDDGTKAVVEAWGVTP